MISQQDIKNILAASINAPSGSNSQPWRFEFRDGELTVNALPERDHPILNYRHRGTWIAHGALIENIRISANALGYRANIKAFPDAKNQNVTARIGFEKSVPGEEFLFRSIPKRSTNRKPFNATLITYTQQKYLENSVEEIGTGGVEVKFIQDRKKIERVGQAVAVNEIVTLENRQLHKLFFDEIVWNREDEKKRQMGLYLKTMELKPPQELALKIFRSWLAMNLLNKLGIARVIAKGNAKNYAKTPLMAAIIVRDNDQDFINAGRIIERIWLKALRLGCGLQLITGTMFFWQGIVLGKSEQFSREHMDLIKSEYETIKSSFDVQDGIVTAVLRIGSKGEPSARSSKKEPEIRFL